MYSSNLALSFMSYPAQSLAKSCKLIPVMLMRIVVLGQRYALHEYLQVLVITVGIAVFMLFEDGGKAGKGSSTSVVGLLLCLVSLLLDGFTGPTQERINAQHKPSSPSRTSHRAAAAHHSAAQRRTHVAELPLRLLPLPGMVVSVAQMMFFLNFWAILLVLVLLLATGQLWSGLAFFRGRRCPPPASGGASLAAVLTEELTDRCASLAAPPVRPSASAGPSVSRSAP